MKTNALILCITLMLFPALVNAQELFVAPSPEGWERAEYTHRQADFPKINAKGEASSPFRRIRQWKPTATVFPDS